jgi:hypothetical protein
MVPMTTMVLDASDIFLSLRKILGGSGFKGSEFKDCGFWLPVTGFWQPQRADLLSMISG